VLFFAGGEREAAGGVVSLALSLRIWTGRRTMQQKVYWLDYDPVAFAVLLIGIGMIGLLALSI
jgi:hypothetical protein